MTLLQRECVTGIWVSMRVGKTRKLSLVLVYVRFSAGVAGS